MTELRFRHVHRNHAVLVGVVQGVAVDVGDTKKDVSELKVFTAEIKTTIKTSAKWLAAIIIGCGAAAWIFEHIVFKH